MSTQTTTGGENDFFELALGAMEELAEDKTVATSTRRSKLLKLQEFLNQLLEDLEELPVAADEP